MKRTWQLGAGMAAASMVVAGLSLEVAGAQQQPTQGQYQGIRLAVLDVSKVFKEYVKFKSLAETFKAELETKEGQLKTDEQQIRAKIESAKDIKSPADRERIEKEVNDLKFAFDRNRQKFRGDLMRKEADMYVTVYKELTDLLSSYCQENGIHLVLRLQDEEKEDPNAVLQMIQRQVVYTHPNLNLTDVIVAGLNQRMKAQP